MDEGYQAGTEGLNYAAEKGARHRDHGTAPRRGAGPGRWQSKKSLWASGGHSRTAAEWGLRWLWGCPEIMVVLSGMGTMQQVKDNLLALRKRRQTVIADGDQSGSMKP